MRRGTYSDEDFLSGGVILRDGRTGDSDDELSNTHSRRSEDHQRSSTDFICCPHSEWRRAGINDVCSDCNQERVAYPTVLEKRSAVVDCLVNTSDRLSPVTLSLTDEIDTGQLLQCLDSHPRQSPLQRFTLSSSETIRPRSSPVLSFMFKIRRDSRILLRHFHRILGGT